MSKPLPEILFGMFYDLAKVIGVNLNPDQNERLRIKTDQLAKKFEQLIRDTTVTVAKQLQNATESGFNKADEKFAEVRETLKEIETCTSFLQEQLTEISETFSNVLQTVRNEAESQQTGSSAPEASEPSQTPTEQTKQARDEQETSPNST